MWLSGFWGWGEADAGEWQSLYRVEGARRRLKAARVEAAEAQQARARRAADMRRWREEARTWRQTNHAQIERDSRLRNRNRTKSPVWAPGSRNYRMWAMYRAGGLALADVGRAFGLSGQRVSGIIRAQQAVEDARVVLGAEKWRRLAARQNLGRPIDLDAKHGGGPRDVWLTYLPSPDPRLDNVVPV